ncbi:MAG: hypothetical protein QG661_2035 [Actinomycetota bacterium]|nr:hypothetical protein [Actinomycetota bacterium]
MTRTTTRSTASDEETEMTTTRTRRDTTASPNPIRSRTSRNTNRAGITMVGAAAGRHPRAVRAHISGASSATAAVRHGA